MSDTTRRGTLRKNRKYCLSLTKIKAKGQPRGLGRFSDSPEACAKASDERPKLSAPPRPSHRGPLAEALLSRPRPARPQTGYQFSDSPEAGLGNNLVTSVPTDSSDKTSRPVNAPNYSRNVSRTLAQYRQSDRRDRGSGAAGVTYHYAHHCAPC